MSGFGPLTGYVSNLFSLKGGSSQLGGFSNSPAEVASEVSWAAAQWGSDDPDNEAAAILNFTASQGGEYSQNNYQAAALLSNSNGAGSGAKTNAPGITPLVSNPGGSGDFDWTKDILPNTSDIGKATSGIVDAGTKLFGLAIGSAIAILIGFGLVLLGINSLTSGAIQKGIGDALKNIKEGAA